ncbi:hypothetical protein BC829DRAFT_393278, partial [Chytridium lagenaria]
ELAPEVNRRLHALQNLQDQHASIESKFREEVLALEKKYLHQYKPLYEKRAAIIAGVVEPTDEESKRPEKKEDDDEDDLGPAGPPPADGSGVKGVPDFWLTALRNHPQISEEITDLDEEALKSLTNITFAYLEDNPVKRLFLQHPSYQTYYLINSTDNSFGDIIYDRAEGCDIKWKEGKNLSVTVEIKKQRHKDKNVKKTVPAPTFFSFFKPPNPADEDDEEAAAAAEDKLESDYEIGEIIKEKIIPHAVDWFTGRALEFEDGFMGDDGEWDGEDDAEGDDDDDVDEDDEDGAAGGAAGGDGEKPPECKQQ